MWSSKHPLYLSMCFLDSPSTKSLKLQIGIFQTHISRKDPSHPHLSFLNYTYSMNVQVVNSCLLDMGDTHYYL